MKISIKLYGMMALIAKKEILILELDEEITLKGVLDEIVERFGEEMKLELIDTYTNEYSHSLILLNNKLMPLVSNLSKQIKDGDKISLISFCAGG